MGVRLALVAYLQHHGDVDMETWHTPVRTPWREQGMGEAFQEVGEGPACLSIRGLGRKAIDVGWKSVTAG